MAVLSGEQQAVFLSCVEMLTEHMRLMLQDETDANAPAGAAQDQSQTVVGLEVPQRIMLDTTAASQLYDLLGAALGRKPDA